MRQAEANPLGQLRGALGKIEARPFPPHAENDGLDEWLMELLEIDGYLVGLAQTALAGGRVSGKVQDLAQLSTSLESLEMSSLSVEDVRVLDQCRDYLDELGELLDALRGLGLEVMRP